MSDADSCCDSSRKRGHTTQVVMLAAVGVVRACVDMYLRTTQRRNRDGSVVRYVTLAHNRRVEGTTRAEVLVNLGREDRLDADGLRRLVASINR